MKLLSFCCLALAIAPGCLLVQPLDDAKSNGGASAQGGSNGAGHTSSGGATGRAGAGNPGAGAGGRPSSNGGAANGGGPPSGVDFSLFLGKWTLTSGTLSTDCGTGTPMTSDLTPGSYDTVELGTTSDLLFDGATSCPLDADVIDRTATATPGQTCTTTDPNSGNVIDIYWDSFTFVVLSDGTTAQGTIDLTSSLTSNGTDFTCIQHEEISYTHTL